MQQTEEDKTTMTILDWDGVGEPVEDERVEIDPLPLDETGLPA